MEKFQQNYISFSTIKVTLWTFNRAPIRTVFIDLIIEGTKACPNAFKLTSWRLRENVAHPRPSTCPSGRTGRRRSFPEQLGRSPLARLQGASPWTLPETAVTAPAATVACDGALGAVLRVTLGVKGAGHWDECQQRRGRRVNARTLLSGNTALTNVGKLLVSYPLLAPRELTFLRHR